uniref:Ribosome assembly protein METTL17, mitochondrial n=1 Tax=Sphaeramia orbicularis TaxID=375764 RepID=A0A673B0Z8_9TELE
YLKMASRSYIACVLCQRAVQLKMTYRGMSTAAHQQPQVDFLKGALHRKHPGVTNLNTLRLPEELQVAALSVIHRAQIMRLQERTQSLTNFLWSRKRAIEDVTLKQKAISLEKELWEKEMAKRGDIDEQAVEDRIRKKVLSELRRTTYHWTPLKYDEDLGVVYMAARLAGAYAAVRRALNEIKKRDSCFTPHSLLDFGSGLGTVVWASHSCWGDSLKEMVCVDSSGPMNTLAERLLKGDDERGEPHIKHVYFRQFLPVSPKVQFDVVVAAFTLSELPNVKDREDAVFTLWRKTSSYLVLVENGTKEGHQMLMEARDTLLNRRLSLTPDQRRCACFKPSHSVFWPCLFLTVFFLQCPHELMCPKLAHAPIVPCNFQQMYHPLPLPGHNEQLMEKFSYLILTRADQAKVETQRDVEWARLIAPVQPRSRHVHCRMCCPDGQLQHLVVTARKHGSGQLFYSCSLVYSWVLLFFSLFFFFFFTRLY